MHAKLLARNEHQARHEYRRGLYNVGTMVGDAYANCYSLKLQGHNLGMNCVCFGYLTGRYIAENE